MFATIIKADEVERKFVRQLAFDVDRRHDESRRAKISRDLPDNLRGGKGAENLGRRHLGDAAGGKSRQIEYGRIGNAKILLRFSIETIREQRCPFTETVVENADAAANHELWLRRATRCARG